MRILLPVTLLAAGLFSSAVASTGAAADRAQGTASAPTVSPAAFDREALVTALDRQLEEARAAGFSGSVLVADATGSVYARSFGEADPVTGAPVTATTRFNLASTGKMFTAVAVLQLVQRGRLDLDAPVGRYLPDWPVPAVRERVTLRQLLTHTSGLGMFWGPAFDARRPSLERLDDYRPLLAQEPAFEPGTGWRYSNTGFQILGLVIEAVSGQPYDAYLATHVFAPAGMQDTGFFTMDGRASGVARPHAGGTGPDRNRLLRMPEPRGGAAGGGYSTPADLLRFHRALTRGRLLDARHLALLFAPVDLPAGTRAPPHGLGLLRYPVGHDVAYAHPGGAPGVGVDFRALRDAGWAVIVMSNSSEPRTMPLADALLATLARAGGPDLRFPGMGGPRRIIVGAG